jgi:hypothetical protein
MGWFQRRPVSTGLGVAHLHSAESGLYSHGACPTGTPQPRRLALQSGPGPRGTQAQWPATSDALAWQHVSMAASSRRRSVLAASALAQRRHGNGGGAPVTKSCADQRGGRRRRSSVWTRSPPWWPTKFTLSAGWHAQANSQDLRSYGISKVANR